MKKAIKIILIILGALVILCVAIYVRARLLPQTPNSINHLEEDAACSKANGGRPCF